MRNVNHRAYVWQPRPLVAALSTTRVPDAGPALAPVSPHQGGPRSVDDV
jgi:hypothetical protein